jgi:hypothetical protein
MKFHLFLLSILVFGVSASAQITSAENGLMVSPGNNAVQLGGSLLQNTTIDLGASNSLFFKKGSDYLFTINSNGNLGIGTNSPQGRLSFTNCDQTEEPMGITWYNPNNTAYAIHRTAGAWTAPDYQQLRVAWNTGIIIDPGVSYGKSYLEVVGSGLRVTQGNVGIGTATPGNRLSIATSVANTSGLQFVNLSGASPAVTGNGKVLSLDNGGNVVLVNDVGGAGTIWALTGNSLTDPNNNFIGTADAQPLVFRTNNQPRVRLQANGNLLLNKSEDNGMIFQAVGDGSFIAAVDLGTSLSFGDNQHNKVLGIRTYGSGAGTDRYSTIGHNMPEAASMYDATKQGGGIYLDDRSIVLPIRFMIKKPNDNSATYAGGVAASGNFLIGHTKDQAGYKLQVDGNVRARKVHVDQDTWADYVFDKNYKLRSIDELEQYIQQQKHLPEVPSAAEVKKEGIDLGDNQAMLLKKIEELTLYVIEQNKKIEALEKLVLQQQKDKEAQQQ